MQYIFVIFTLIPPWYTFQPKFVTYLFIRWSAEFVLFCPYIHGYGGHPHTVAWFPKKTPAINSSSARGGDLAPPHSTWLVWSCVGSHSYWEFVSTAVLSCPGDSFSLLFPDLGFYSISTPSSMMVSNPWGGVEWDCKCPIYSWASHRHTDTLASCEFDLTTVPCTALLWCSPRASLICRYREMDAEGSFILCPLARW